jgi:hypothetical protein
MEGTIPALSRRLPNERAVYCTPRSVWWISPAAGFRQSLPLPEVDLELLYPMLPRVVRDAKLPGYLGNAHVWRGADKADGFSFELWRVAWCRSRHLVHSLRWRSHPKLSCVRRRGSSPDIHYSVVLDNRYATWNAYDQRFWPAWYLIDADGFVRYKHFGEGAYGDTERKVQELLAEKERISN